MPAPTDLAFLTAAEVGRLFRSREVSPVELTRVLLERAERLQPSLRAFITPTPETALAEAAAAEQALLAGDDRPLLGVPVAYKDIFLTAGVRTMAGSRIHEHWVPSTTATTIRSLHNAGVVCLGKLTTHEFAAGLTPEEHLQPPARNPWNPERIPGGSSSGSGTALAAGLVAGALGSDTGGSIRHPASACGVVGLKPSYGRCSRAGVVPLSWSLDHVGPLARTCEDVALLLQGIAGYDPHDPSSIDVPVPDYRVALQQGVTGLRIGVLRAWYEERTHPDVIAAVDAAIDVLRTLGAEVINVEFPAAALERVQGIIHAAEAYAYHRRDLEEHRDRFSEWVRNRFLMGALFTADEYVNALRAQSVVRHEMSELMHNVDLLLSPTRGKTALTFPEAYADYAGAVSFTPLFNLTGQPALSIPCGFGSDGLPIGLQLAGRPFEEEIVLAAGHAYEQATEWHHRHPEL